MLQFKTPHFSPNRLLQEVENGCWRQDSVLICVLAHWRYPLPALFARKNVVVRRVRLKSAEEDRAMTLNTDVARLEDQRPVEMAIPRSGICFDGHSIKEVCWI